MRLSFATLVARAVDECRRAWEDGRDVMIDLHMLPVAEARVAIEVSTAASLSRVSMLFHVSIHLSISPTCLLGQVALDALSGAPRVVRPSLKLLAGRGNHSLGAPRVSLSLS